MIQIGGQVYSFDDPRVIAALAGAALLVVLFALLIQTLRVAARSARMTDPLLYQMNSLGQRVQSLSDGQQQRL